MWWCMHLVARRPSTHGIMIFLVGMKAEALPKKNANLFCKQNEGN